MKIDQDGMEEPDDPEMKDEEEVHSHQFSNCGGCEDTGAPIDAPFRVSDAER